MAVDALETVPYEVTFQISESVPLGIVHETGKRFWESSVVRNGMHAWGSPHVFDDGAMWDEDNFGRFVVVKGRVRAPQKGATGDLLGRR